MTRIPIPAGSLHLRSHQLWNEQWFLLAAGDFESRRYNAMTVSWGSLGILWNLPFAQVFVRPTRYTWEFMEEFDTFTLNAFPESCRSALDLLGSRSGREGDKIGASGLTPIVSSRVQAPGFDEAELIIECRKIYWNDLDPARFLLPSIEGHYPKHDYHRVYYGEVLAVHGNRRFAA